MLSAHKYAKVNALISARRAVFLVAVFATLPHLFGWMFADNPAHLVSVHGTLESVQIRTVIGSKLAPHDIVRIRLTTSDGENLVFLQSGLQEYYPQLRALSKGDRVSIKYAPGMDDRFYELGRGEQVIIDSAKLSASEAATRKSAGNSPFLLVLNAAPWFLWGVVVALTFAIGINARSPR